MLIFRWQANRLFSRNDAKNMKYFIKTFGCAGNIADSERVAAMYQACGYKEAKDYDSADVVVINTCIVRKSAEDRVYGLVKNLARRKDLNKNFKIVVTGCLVGAAHREPSGQRLKDLQRILPNVDEFLPIEEVGFEYAPVRKDKENALVLISNGCNNMCTFCIVPYSRGKEISRPFAEIMHEVEHLLLQGYSEITLLGQNVNSYGADLLQQGEVDFELPNGKKVEPVMVKHLGRVRIPTLFPYLLDSVAKIEVKLPNGAIKKFKKVNFMSSNPWDFSDELIKVIAANKNVNREIHLPVQSGNNDILKKMNRWYTREEYLELIKKIKNTVSEAQFTTDVIVGFPNETEEQFNDTLDLFKQINFNIAYISMYSPRKGTYGASKLEDNISYDEKKKRWNILNDLTNKKK